MKRFSSVLRVVVCVSVLAFALGVPVTRAAGPPGGLDVTVVNTPLPVQGTVNVGNFPASNTVSGAVSITGTPNVNVMNTPTVNVGNSLKPSQLVTLENSSASPGSCPSGGGIKVDSLQNPDATTSPFSIPTGKVLVITSAQAVGLSGAGHVGNLALERATAAASNDLASQTGQFDSSGVFSAVFNFPTGAVIKSGISLCLVAFDPSALAFVAGTVVVQGYLATDE